MRRKKQRGEISKKRHARGDKDDTDYEGRKRRRRGGGDRKRRRRRGRQEKGEGARGAKAGKPLDNVSIKG